MYVTVIKLKQVFSLICTDVLFIFLPHFVFVEYMKKYVTTYDNDFILKENHLLSNNIKLCLCWLRKKSLHYFETSENKIRSNCCST